MAFNEIKYCPGTLAEGHTTYSRACLSKLFKGRKVSHILPYDSPASNSETDELFNDNRKTDVNFRCTGEIFSIA